MIRISRLAATSVALFMLAGPAFAQTQPSPSHLALARDVAISSGMSRSFDAMSEPFLQQLQQMNVTRPEIRTDLDQVVAMLRPELEQQKQKMIDNAARAFASRLTEAELKDVATFYKSPAGVKYVQIQPGVLDDIVRDLATWSQQTAQFVMTRAREEMSKRGHQLN
ncbi:hypothetical protein BB934_04175 [Microvirga ossetica]|jgi:uncharacterized protein|uniref:DUF2059 domain-containing protein n=1 Tax=Microvirga ossetica TaxID=1882682 RepID=A0A1B2ECC0_9HYPH|nr:DUF2059 domain-containing protein [Microvirga ossetica]ANY77522.1 hypothetical protein BB934_04175 [Microvirga ossetica]